VTAHTEVYLRCDWPECPRSLDTHRRLLRDARADAVKDHGWVSGAGLDLCGPGRAAGHATAGHIPQAKQDRSRGRTWVQVGCSCGWAESEKTIRAGVLYRWLDHIRYRWLDHIRRDVLASSVTESEATSA